MFDNKRSILILFILCFFTLGTLSYAAGGGKILAKLIKKAPTLNSFVTKTHRELTQHFHRLRVDLPSSGVKKVLQVSAVAPVAEVLKGEETKRPTVYPLYINSSEPGSIVKVLNIKPKYVPGIKLEKGDYYISVEKDGFRSKRFWVSLDGENKNGDNLSYEYDVKLDPIGLPNCEQNIDVENYNSGIAGTKGRLYQIKGYFKNVNIHDLVYSYGEVNKTAGYLKVLHNEIRENYAEIHIAQPTNLTADDIKTGRSVEIDSNRFVLQIVSFSQVGSDAIFVNQAIMPDSIFVTDAGKGFFCEHEFNF